MKRFKAMVQPAITKFCSSSRDTVILDDDSPFGNSSNQHILTAPLNLMFSDDEFSISSQSKLDDSNHNNSRAKSPEALSDLGDLFESNANDFPHEIGVGDSDLDLFESNCADSVYNRHIGAVSDGWLLKPLQAVDTANISHNLDNLQKSSLELSIPPENTNTYKGYPTSGSSLPLRQTPTQLSDLKLSSSSRSWRVGESNREFVKMNEFEIVESKNVSAKACGTDMKLPKGRPSYDEIINNLDSAIRSTTASIDLVTKNRNQLVKSPSERKREHLEPNRLQRPDQSKWSLMKGKIISIRHENQD